MSGGSFNYLCHAHDLGDRRGDIEEMAKAIEAYDHPYASVLARDTRRVLGFLKSADTQAERLHEVWHDVEWHHSNDCGEDQVLQAIQEYRERS